MGSERTAAAAGKVGEVRRDPFAMLPFCGYHMADYINHWLSLGRKITRLPLIFGVNWFRTDANGKFLWDGYGENMRVLLWIVQRATGCARAVESPLGLVPTYEDLNLDGLENFGPDQYQELMSIDRERWLEEIHLHEELFDKLGEKLPRELTLTKEQLLAGLERSPARWEAQ